MTPMEFESLGGTPAPEGHDPERLKRVPGGTKFAMGQQYHLTGLVDPWANVLPAWEAIAARAQVRLFSIRWPDAHSPDFLAERL